MLIDCHAHHVAAPFNTDYLSWMKRTGRQDFGPVYLWNDPAFENPSLRCEKMAACGISHSLITYSANITQILDAACETNGLARSQAVRLLNDRTIALCRESKGRLLATALIDLRLGDEALPEISRCGGEVKGYSVIAAYHMDGQLRFLDSPVFEPFWAEAEQAGKPVFIHFSNLYKINDPAAPLPGFMNDTLLYAGMGQLMEDALCVARLVLSGVFDRHPGLKVVMGQAGGMYPFMLERMEMLYTMYSAGAAKAGRHVTDPAVPEHFLRNMKNYTDNVYVDTHSMSAEAIACAAKIVGSDRILFGSDYPITPDRWGMEHALNQLKKLPGELYEQIAFKNARALLRI